MLPTSTCEFGTWTAGTRTTLPRPPRLKAPLNRLQVASALARLRCIDARGDLERLSGGSSWRGYNYPFTPPVGDSDSLSRWRSNAAYKNRVTVTCSVVTSVRNRQWGRAAARWRVHRLSVTGSPRPRCRLFRACACLRPALSPSLTMPSVGGAGSGSGRP